MYRYWDGESWSDEVSATPLANPPWGRPADPGSPDETDNPRTSAPNRSRAALAITITIGAVVVALIAFFVIRLTSGPGPGPGTPPATQPETPATTTNLCTRQNPDNVRFDHPTGDGRVYGGKLSFPQLPSPWSDQNTDENRIPYSRDVIQQVIPVHGESDGEEPWIIGVAVGELFAGDGFYDPEEGAPLITDCVIKTLYGPQSVTRTTLRSQPYSVDGYDGWITETNLGLSVPNLSTTSEVAIVIVLRTGEVTSFFFASIPNDAEQYRPDVDQAMAGLHVVI